MAPGLPFIAIGRNPWIAWGGTNLHAASSDFYDVSDLPSEEISERREIIKVRWWPDRQVVLRETPLGPIISDAPLLGLNRDRPVALRWMGHRASDEFTAMLKVNQARNWEDFRNAVNGISVPGQTMTYADVQGHVRRSMAVRLPARQPHHLHCFLLDSHTTGHWQRIVSGAELSADAAPHQDFVFSANEPPQPTSVPVGIFFSPLDRAVRLRALIADQPPTEKADLSDALCDDYMATSHELAGLFVKALRSSRRDTAGQQPDELITLLADWDGRY
jgi:penicillin amidase